MKKIAFTSNGIIINENNQTRKASEKEAGDFLKTLVPSEKNGSKLSAVKYESGNVFARYENGKTFKKNVLAQSSVKQTEPTSSGDKANPDLKTPRSEKHSKPETKEITKDRPDVSSPKEIRKKEYGVGGDKGADNHTDIIPRSKSNSGLGGSKKTTFEKEKALDATSGKPDTYVQKLVDSKKPTPTGKDNRTSAGTNTASSENGLQVKSDSELYNKIIMAKEEDDKDDKKDKKSLPPWLKDKEKKDDKKDSKDEKETDDKEDKDDSDDNKKEAMLVQELREKLAAAEQTINTLKNESNKSKVREARQIPALKLALAYRETNPEQFPTVESVVGKATELCKQMNTDALESTFEQVKAIRMASNKTQQMNKTASSNDGVSTAFASTLETLSDANPNGVDAIREALMANTALGKKMAEIDAYHNSNK